MEKHQWNRWAQILELFVFVDDAFLRHSLSGFFIYLIMDVVAWNKCDINELVMRVFVLAINEVRVLVIPVNAHEASISIWILESFEELSLLVPDRVEMLVVLICALVGFQKCFLSYTVFGSIASEQPSNVLRIKLLLFSTVVFKRNCKSEIDLIQVHRVFRLIKIDFVVCWDVRIMSFL